MGGVAPSAAYPLRPGPRHQGQSCFRSSLGNDSTSDGRPTGTGSMLDGSGRLMRPEPWSSQPWQFAVSPIKSAPHKNARNSRLFRPPIDLLAFDIAVPEFRFFITCLSRATGAIEPRDRTFANQTLRPDCSPSNRQATSKAETRFSTLLGKVLGIVLNGSDPLPGWQNHGPKDSNGESPSRFGTNPSFGRLGSVKWAGRGSRACGRLAGTFDQDPMRIVTYGSNDY